jgi:hypothetical protein
MNLEVTKGPWAGHRIARARKAGRCDYWKGRFNGGRCPNVIAADDHYLNGENNPYKAGGYAQDRYCMDCAGEEARQALMEKTHERLYSLIPETCSQ